MNAVPASVAAHSASTREIAHPALSDMEYLVACP